MAQKEKKEIKISEVVGDIFKKREALLILIIVVFSLCVSVKAPVFLTFENLTNVLKSCTITGVFSLAVFLVIVSGGFDVSFSAIAQATQYFTVWIMLNYFPGGGNLFWTFLIAIVMGLGLGLVNGFLIYHFKMPPIIITISTQNLIYGIMYVVTKGKLLYTVPSYIWPLSNTRIFERTAENGSMYGLSVVVLVWLGLSVLIALFLKKTVTGRSIYWVGGNAIAAERVGISRAKSTLTIYGLAGAIAAIGGIVQVSIVQTVIPNSIVGTELPIIGAVVLGGAAVTGGKGSVLGTFLGVFLFALINNSLTLLQISSYWYNVFTGAVILLSIFLNAFQEWQQSKRRVRVKVA